ncbi:MAG: preprotein translocase subunit YajC [Fibrobacteraceae bacterium]|nr:preprotein translocase subunit YajC [Fibrobacteraceae bacterium]
MKIKVLLLTLSSAATLFAQEAEQAAEQQPSAIGSFLPLILLFVVMWLFFIRPKQKEMKQMDAMRKQLKKGDKVMTAAGIIGTIFAMEDNSITISTGNGTKIDFDKAAILRVINPEVKAAEPAKEEKK